MGKRFTFDFFEVVPAPESKRPFEDLFDQVAKLPLDASRNVPRGENIIRLQLDERVKMLRLGDFIKIRMGNLPNKASLAGAVGALGLSANEGVSDGTVFVYEPVSRLLVVQRNHNGVTGGQIVSYVCELTRAALVTVRPFLRKDVMDRLANLRECREIEVSIAGLDHLIGLDDHGQSTSQLIRTAKMFEAPRLKFTASMGHGDGTLVRVREMIGELLDLNAELKKTRVNRIVVSGLDDEGNKDVLDILRFKMIETSEECLPDGNREYPYAVRKAELRKAFTKRMSEVRAILRLDDEASHDGAAD